MYITLFMSLLKAIVKTLISPIQLAFLLALVGLLFSFLGNKKKAKIFYSIAAGWLLIFSQPYVTDLLLYPLEYGYTNPTTQSDIQANPDFILPLACFFNTEGNAPELSRWSNCSTQRLLKASRLAESHKAQLLLTGGNFLKNKDINYAEKAKQFVLEYGVASSNIVVVGKGGTTREELNSVRELLSNKKVLIVTTATHRLRVKLLIHELSIEADIIGVNHHSNGELIPYLTFPEAGSLQKARHAFYEYLAIVKYKIENALQNKV